MLVASQVSQAAAALADGRHQPRFESRRNITDGKHFVELDSLASRLGHDPALWTIRQMTLAARPDRPIHGVIQVVIQSSHEPNARHGTGPSTPRTGAGPPTSWGRGGP